MYVHSWYTMREKKKGTAQRESHSFGRAERLECSESFPSLWFQDKSLFLSSHSGSLQTRGMAKFTRYPWWQSSSQSNPCCSSFHSSGEKTKAYSICSGNNLAFERTILYYISFYLRRKFTKKVETQQSAWPQTNSQDCTQPSARSCWQFFPKRDLSEDGYYRYPFFYSYK